MDVFKDSLLHRLSSHGEQSETGSENIRHRPSFSDDLIRKSLLEIDLTKIRQDAKTDSDVRKKLGNDARSLDAFGQSTLVPSTKHTPGVEFARGDWEKKTRMVLHEILRVDHISKSDSITGSSRWEWRTHASEVFSSSSLVDSVSLILSTFAGAFESVISFESFCHAVLRLPHGLYYLGCVLRECRQYILPICDFFMSQSSGEDLEDPASIFYSRVLAFIGRIFPRYLAHLRVLSLNQQKYFNLVLYSILEDFKVSSQESVSGLSTPARKSLEEELSDVFHELLVAPESDSRLRSWAASNLKLASCSTNSVFEECRLQLIVHAHKILPADSLSIPDHLIPPATQIVRVFFSLKELCDITLSVDEYRVLSKLLLCRPSLNAEGNAYIVLALSCFTAFPDLFVDNSVVLEFNQWINWQLNVDSSVLEEQFPSGGTFLEVLLLIASQLRVSQYKDITEILINYLGFKVHLRGNMVVKLKNQFNEIFKEDSLLRHSLRVPPTKNLNATFQSALPLNSVQSLLQSKKFSSYSVSLKDWVLNQIRKCSLPIHPTMIQVLASYIQTTLPEIKKAVGVKDEHVCHLFRFSPVDVLSVIYDEPELTRSQIRNLRTIDLFRTNRLSDPNQNAPRVLMAFFVLAYNQFYRSELKRYLAASNSECSPYGMEVMEKIPFKQLLALTNRHHMLFDPLCDILSRLVIEFLPQLRSVFDQIDPDWSADEGVSKRVPKLSTAILENADNLRRYLDLLARLPRKNIGVYMDDFLQIVPVVSKGEPDVISLDAFEKVWLELSNVDPNELFLATTNALMKEEKHFTSLSFLDLCFEPLHVFRCEFGMLRLPHWTRIIIRTFAFFLAASRVYITQQLEEVDQKESTKSSGDDTLREERKRTMFQLQSSVAAQVLIEQCSLKRSPTDFLLPKKLPESHNIICAFIHQLIIANPNLARLLVFQGFPSTCIPSIVRGVESLHICFDFLHAAISLPTVEKKLFALELTSFLCVKFRINRAVVAAKLALDVILTMLVAYPHSARNQIIQVGAACLARIGNVFPPLREDCLELLDMMSVMTEADAACDRNWRRVGRTLLGDGSQFGDDLSAVLFAAKECAAGIVPLSA